MSEWWHDVLAKLPADERKALSRMPDDEIAAGLSTGSIQYLAAWQAHGGYQRYRDRQIADQQADIRRLVEAKASTRAIVDAVIELSVIFNSEQRLGGLIKTLTGLPTRVFWPAFREVWCMCDDTWAHRSRLMIVLRHHSDTSPARKNDHLEPLLIYRGCSAARVHGISWTTSRKVAFGFARGHRGIPVRSAVLATARVPRSAIFTHINSRKEREVLVDPYRLIEVHAQTWSV